MCRDRLIKIFHDEPETISWIHSFCSGDTLLDVGANIGTYSIFAAKLKGVKCLAFEPMVENFRALLMNVSHNQLNDVVTCYPYGVYERELKSRIYMSQPFNAGHALNSVEKNVNYALAPHVQRISHEVYLTTLDGLDFDRKSPYHLKIDVDGQELSVVKGAVNTLEADACRSVLIELDNSMDEHKRVIKILTSLGFGYDQFQVNESGRLFQSVSTMFANYANFIFYK